MKIPPRRNRRKTNKQSHQNYSPKNSGLKMNGSAGAVRGYTYGLGLMSDIEM